jgi:predicted SAM-dependent methyltransferase
VSGRYVNLGCGARYHREWTNIDLAPAGPGVIAHDLSRGVPLESQSCDVVYHAHVLEHLRRDDAARLLAECYRVLRPGGVLRVVVPDLEQICCAYLRQLDLALASPERPSGDYDWMMLELYDQTVRERSGGEMAAYLARQPLPNPEFVFGRIGEEGRNLVRALGPRAEPPHLVPRLTRRAARALLGAARLAARRLREIPLRLLLGREGLRAYRVAQFRLSGEVHLWMYDRYSLARLLMSAGFARPAQQLATTSLIPDWQRFELDAGANGAPHKPDSLYMEATRPL